MAPPNFSVPGVGVGKAIRRSARPVPGASPDVLSQLVATSWRQIQFPTLMVSAKGGQRLVRHQRMDRDGVFVENTGREGYEFTCKIPWINTIVHGPTESWGPLMPGVYRQIVAALEDRSTGNFVHPTYGQRKCKAEDWEETLDPNFRGGPTMVGKWVETVDGADANAVAVANTAPIPIAAAAAASLDATFVSLVPPPNTGTPGGISLTDFINGLGSIADAFTLFQMQVLGQINAVVSAMTGLLGKFGYQPGFTDATNRLISALHAIAANATASSKPVSYYVAPAPTTLAQVALRVGADVADLLALNPSLARSLVIPAQAVVTYYTP